MLSLTLLFTSLLAGFAAAQNSTFDQNSVDLTTRTQWCQGELNNCPLLCGGPTNTKSNICVATNLMGYQCTCNNGSAPANIADYVNTVPNSICYQQFTDCRNANPGSQACKTCGTLQPTDVKAIVASSTASAAATSSVASTAPAPSATKKSNAGRVEGAVGGVAAGVIAAVLL